MSRVIDLKTCSVFIDENNFCVIEVKSLDVDIISEEDAIESCEAVYQVCAAKKTPLLFDMSRFNGQIAPGVRAIFRHNKKLDQIKYCNAVVVKTLGNRIIVNFYIKFNKPATLLKIFSNKENAKKWLLKNRNKTSVLV